ncbi:EAL domain-containing protein [Arthrobacter sp. Soc17.1.1.1]|uniref:EAL domain-containing protein n=1 Tax=Arthrobacter sp. Soc17.1.1.1 TaxID=3121277 RepID=UPI002FE45AE3
MVIAVCEGHGAGTAYQPIVDTARGSIVGYEALARFPGYEQKNPEVWFAAARDFGLSAALEAATLRSALARRSDLPVNCFLTVNISPALLLNGEVQAVWADQGGLGGIVVELTEQTPIESYLELEPALHRLRSAGAMIAVDDAGAGYAGLNHLLAIRPALIKLDRELVRDIDEDPAKRALVEMIGMFAGRIDAWILAEGIERVEELDALIALKVPLVQGYLLGRPQASWSSLDPDLAHRMLTRTRDTGGATLRRVLETCPTAPSTRAAAALLAAQPHLRRVVVIDDHQRPLWIVDAQHADLGVASPGVRLNLDTPLNDALHRALTRGEQQRYDSLMITDNAGRYTGVVHMDRLITAAITPTT